MTTEEIKTDQVKAGQRKEYLSNSLTEDKASPCPLEQFKKWYAEATKSSIIEPNAMNIATVNKNGRPSSRTVLLREFSKKGFIFYTNYDSQKGKEITQNSEVALCFYWDALERQVRINASIEKISREASENYFQNRPKNAQISAYVSNQSASIKDRAALEKQYAEAEVKFKNIEVPIPNNWGGYLAKPTNFEFWQGRKGRLHDRLRYFKDNIQSDNPTWKIERLCP